MTIDIVEEAVAALQGYAEVSIAFRVESRFRVEPAEQRPDGYALVEEQLASYVKDYDAIKAEAPPNWARRWDIGNWGILSALNGDLRVGGAVIAWKTEGLEMLQGREDLAVLWDLRVGPEYRRKGVGGMLFHRAVAWARERGCRELVVETQNINVPACRFYARQGCELSAINRHAYPTLQDEIQILWSMPL